MQALATRINPTFFSFWIGANDILLYSLSGGDQGGETLTPDANFQFAYSSMINSLTANGAKGVVANIPSITSIPYFNTVKWNGLTMDATQASGANSNPQLVGYNQALQGAAGAGLITQAEAAARTITFAAGDNAFVVTDGSLTSIVLPPGSGNPPLPNMRQIKGNEHIIMVTPGDSLRCAGWGSSKPLAENYTLLDSEVNGINAKVASYNSFIKSQANTKGLAFVDANKIMSELETGLVYDGVTYNAAYVSGGAFSLDGVHPNTRGYAIIANSFIDAINSTYGAKVPKVDVNSYEGIQFP